MSCDGPFSSASERDPQWVMQLTHSPSSRSRGHWDAHSSHCSPVRLHSTYVLAQGVELASCFKIFSQDTPF